DAAVAQARADLTKAQREMAGTDAEVRRKQQFAAALKQARDSVDLKKYDDAAKSVAAALQLYPQDRDALALRGQIDTAKKAADMAGQKRQDYNRLLIQGRAALQAKKFAEAAKAFQSALD